MPRTRLDHSRLLSDRRVKQWVDENVQAAAPQVKKELETLLARFKERTGNQERLEKVLNLYDECAHRTRAAWGGLAMLVVVGAFTFAGYVSNPESFGPGSELIVLIVFATVVIGVFIYPNARQWYDGDKALRATRKEIQDAVRAKIHFGEVPVQGLQFPAALPVSPK
jgi:hypothetical protein